MRAFFRWLRRGLTLIFVVGVIVGAVYFAYKTTTGIVDEVEFRQEQSRRDGHRADTATYLAPTLEAETLLLSGGEGELVATDEVVVPSEDLGVTPEPSAEVEDELGAGTPEAFVPDTGLNGVSSARNNQVVMVKNGNAPEKVIQAQASATVAPEETEDTPALPTALPTNTMPPTAIPTNTLFPSNTPTPTATGTPTNTFTPTVTFTPSNTPTATVTPYPTLVIEGTYVTPVATPITEIPMRAPLVENDSNIVNIALLGADVSSSLARTDVIIIVSVNKTTGSVSMWHIPRDLLVYIPDNTINRINLVFQVGQQNGWGGPALFKEMFAYNFGVQIDYYARVDFNDFAQIIQQLGGLTVSVDCQLTDWKLIDGFNAPQEAFSTGEGDPWLPYWEQYTLGVGVHKLDSYTALWYARSRVTTNDLDRGRRQMDLLRAMFRQARSQGIFDQVLTLGPQALEIIDTDMDLDDMVGFVPTALTLDFADIERYSLKAGVHMTSWLTPDDGRSVFLGDWAAIRALAQDFVTPPNQNRLSRDSASIEIIDGTLYGLGWGQVASDRLAWEGFSPTVVDNRQLYEVSQIYDFTGEVKDSELARLQTILRISDSNVISQPDPNRQYDYRVIVGRSYNSCIYGTSADEVVLPSVPDDLNQQ